MNMGPGLLSGTSSVCCSLLMESILLQVKLYREDVSCSLDTNITSKD